jgi:hypothetical protein
VETNTITSSRRRRFQYPWHLRVDGGTAGGQIHLPGGLTSATDLSMALNPADLSGLLGDLGSLFDVGSFLSF